jgi:predicted membrane protein
VDSFFTDVIEEEVVILPPVKKQGSRSLMISLVIISIILLLVLVPLAIFVLVPCCCPASSLALWIYMKKESLAEQRGQKVMKRKDTKRITETAQVIGTVEGLSDKESRSKYPLKMTNRVVPQTDVEYDGRNQLMID